MISLDDILTSFVVLWAVIDPIGTLPVFIAVTKNYDSAEKKHIARKASLVAFIILVSFFVVGSFVLKRVGVPLSAFQISGGVILFLFAIDMIFGNSKPEEEIQLVKSGSETAIFPLAIPSIAGPGAILAIVLLAEAPGVALPEKLMTLGIMTFVLLINYLAMIFSGKLHKHIGNSGAIVISKVMGLILASMAANNILVGIKEYFKIN